MVDNRRLDAIRGIASLIVLAGHALQLFVLRVIGQDHPAAIASGVLARHAVLVFFVLSGYLITQSLVTNFQRNGQLSIAEYLAARISRIYPPLLGAVALTVACFWILEALDLNHFGLPGDLYQARSAMALSSWDVVHAITLQGGLLQANGPLWSLFIEAHLYLVALLVALGFTGRLWPIWLAAAGWLFLRGYASPHMPDYLAFAAAWACGAAVILLQRLQAGRIRVLIYSVAGLVLASLVSPPLLLSQGDKLAVGLTQLCWCGFYIWLLILGSQGKRTPAVLQATASSSYSLYVIHWPLLMVALAFAQPFMGASVGKALGFAAVAAASVAALAWAFAQYFEDQRRFKPAIRRVLAIAPAAFSRAFSPRPVQRRAP